MFAYNISMGLFIVLWGIYKDCEQAHDRYHIVCDRYHIVYGKILYMYMDKNSI